MIFLDQINGSAVGQFLAFVGIGSLIDSLIGENNRRAVSRYILRAKGTSLKEFEFSVITALIELVTHPNDINKISKTRVFIYAFCCNVGAEMLFWLTTGSLITIFGEGDFWGTLIFLIALGVPVSYPFDYFSISITKRIFFYEIYPLRELPWLWLKDITISCTPVFFVWWFSWYLFEQIDYFTSMLLLTVVWPGLVGSAFGSVFLSLVQMIVIVSGTLLRGLAAAIQFSGPLLRRFGLEHAPISLCFLTTATLAILVDMATKFL